MAALRAYARPMRSPCAALRGLVLALAMAKRRPAAYALAMGIGLGQTSRFAALWRPVCSPRWRPMRSPWRPCAALCAPWRPSLAQVRRPAESAWLTKGERWAMVNAAFTIGMVNLPWLTQPILTKVGQDHGRGRAPYRQAAYMQAAYMQAAESSAPYRQALKPSGPAGGAYRQALCRQAAFFP